MTAYRDRKNRGMYAPSGAPTEVDEKYEVEPEPEGLDALSKDELLKLAKQRGISPANAAMTKDDLRAALERG